MFFFQLLLKCFQLKLLFNVQLDCWLSCAGKAVALSAQKPAEQRALLPGPRVAGQPCKPLITSSESFFLTGNIRFETEQLYRLIQLDPKNPKACFHFSYLCSFQSKPAEFLLVRNCQISGCCHVHSWGYRGVGSELKSSIQIFPG